MVPWYAISNTVRGDVLFTIFLRSHCLDVLKALSYVVVLSSVTKNVIDFLREESPNRDVVYIPLTESKTLKI